ncbi:hypothetical protein B4100_0863 [Heyndrickxia coagulans]|nr:hypothetical protein B4100_0863 [Heyndrickxia coagulans]
MICLNTNPGIAPGFVFFSRLPGSKAKAGESKKKQEAGSFDCTA